MGDGNQEDAVERGEKGAECCVFIEGVRGKVERREWNCTG